MNRLNEITPVFVEVIRGNSKDLEFGFCYISEKYEVMVMLCPCGCGLKTVIPFVPGEEYDKIAEYKKGHTWKYWRQGGIVTFKESMLNNYCPNKAHWYITSNRIEWH